MTDAVVLENLSKKFGAHQAVESLSLNVPDGSVYGFIGPNGSGKTTTLRMIMHILLPDSGTVEVLGQTGTRAANDQIGYLPEERGLYKKMTVRRQLKYYAALKGVLPADAEAEMDRWLTRLDLLSWIDHKVEALSKGMMQKIQFIATVINRPRLVILDEPFAGLDPVNLETMREAILHLRKDGATVILSTHDMTIAEEMCDFICMIFKGRKVLDGTIDAIQQEHGSQTVRVRLAQGRPALEKIPRVKIVRDLGRIQEVQSGDPGLLLRELSKTAEVEHFEIVRPSLHDIFLQIAGTNGAKSDA